MFTDSTRPMGRNLAVLASLALTSAVAHADLTGDVINGEIQGGPGAFQVDPPTATVGPGIEFNIEFVGTPAFSVDIGANSVRVEQIFGQPINMCCEVLHLFDLDWVGPEGPGRIIGITNFQTDEGPNITESDVTWTDDEIFFNMSGNLWDAGSFASWDLVVEHDDPCVGDLNGDGVVNAADLALLLGAWGPCPGCPADINGDGIVNAADLAMLLGAWGPCPPPLNGPVPPPVTDTLSDVTPESEEQTNDRKPAPRAWIFLGEDGFFGTVGPVIEEEEVVLD